MRHLLLAALLLSTVAPAQQTPPAPKDAQERAQAAAGDIPDKFTPPVAAKDYDKRVVMVPMRDGTKLYTVVVVPKGAVNAPIILTRTPYNAAGRAQRSDSAKMIDALPLADEPFVKAGYIRVYQDVRGKYGSEGDYVVTRPVIGPLNKTKVDHVTDAYDTIDWLVNKTNLPESNGRVGMIGSSYEGFTVVNALLGPHPALKAAVPESPMIDGWMGDDWFHHGAFRLANIAWLGAQTGYKGAGKAPSTGGWDDYDNFREVGSAGTWAQKSGYDQLPFWQRMVAHPSYDAFWQGQALDKLLAANPSNVPTLWEQGLWDQGGHVRRDHVVGGAEGQGQAPQQLAGHGSVAPQPDQPRRARARPLQVGRRHRGAVPRGHGAALLQPVSEGRACRQPARRRDLQHRREPLDRFDQWPLACEQGCANPLKPIYFGDAGGLSFTKGAAGGDSYVSDPAKPVPHLPRPVNFEDGRWGNWLVNDERHADGRTDVLSYRTPVLTAPVRVSGAPFAEIFARTTGTDGDFIVKVIDVAPETNVADPKMGGYQLAISQDIFRGRYRDSFADPKPIPAGSVQRYRFRLPVVNHVFQPGHRIMVQVQSTQFPLYDRNPQTYVPNIFLAKPADYRKATVTVERGGRQASAVLLPVVP